jgi:hypothetical protein
MKLFEFTRPADANAAVAAAAQAKTAGQGADVRFLAGGTTRTRRLIPWAPAASARSA